MRETFVLGAVAYDPKVVTIWDGFVQWFATQDFAFDYVLFTNYERLVEAQFAGVIDCAWNSPLAWIESERLAARLGRSARAVAMRDTDQDLTSVVVVRRTSDYREVGELRGRRVGVGAHDSPQATLLPLAHLAMQGLEPGRDFEVVAHDVLVGKHGDHVGGDLDAVIRCRPDARSRHFLCADRLQYGARPLSAAEDRRDAGARRVGAPRRSRDPASESAEGAADVVAR